MLAKRLARTRTGVACEDTMEQHVAKFACGGMTRGPARYTPGGHTANENKSIREGRPRLRQADEWQCGARNPPAAGCVLPAMTSPRLRSIAARLGLLVFALLHFMATAALPFTHTHALPGATNEVSAGPLDDEGGPQSGHTDTCAVCRTLAHAQAEAADSAVTAGPAEIVAAELSSNETAAARQSFTHARPRAPPAA